MEQSRSYAIVAQPIVSYNLYFSFVIDIAKDVRMTLRDHPQPAARYHPTRPRYEGGSEVVTPQLSFELM